VFILILKKSWEGPPGEISVLRLFSKNVKGVKTLGSVSLCRVQERIFGRPGPLKGISCCGEKRVIQIIYVEWRNEKMDRPGKGPL